MGMVEHSLSIKQILNLFAVQAIQKLNAYLMIIPLLMVTKFSISKRNLIYSYYYFFFRIPHNFFFFSTKNIINIF